VQAFEELCKEKKELFFQLVLFSAAAAKNDPVPSVDKREIVKLLSERSRKFDTAPLLRKLDLAKVNWNTDGWYRLVLKEGSEDIFSHVEFRPKSCKAPCTNRNTRWKTAPRRFCEPQFTPSSQASETVAHVGSDNETVP
jgi:hypothetical protein